MWLLKIWVFLPPTPDAAREAAWRAALAPYYAELGLDPAQIAAGPGRAPFSAEAAALLAEFRPPVVSFHFGLPSAELLAQVKAGAARSSRLPPRWPGPVAGGAWRPCTSFS